MLPSLQPSISCPVSGPMETHIAQAIDGTISEGEAEDDGAAGIPDRPFLSSPSTARDFEDVF